MVTKNTLRKCEGWQVFFENNLKFVKIYEKISFTDQFTDFALCTFAPISELPSHIRPWNFPSSNLHGEKSV